MDLSGDKTGRPYDYLKKIIDQETLNLGVAIPAIVESFDPATQEIEAVPVIRRRLRAEDGSLSVDDRTKHIKIPMCTPYVRTLGFSLTMPIQPGDAVMLVFQDRGIDLWQETGAISDPPESDGTRAHHYTDAIYVFGPISLADAIEDFQIDSTELRNRDRSCAIQIYDDKAQVRAPLFNETTWTAGGSIESFAPIDIEEQALIDVIHDAGVNIENTAGSDIENLAGSDITNTATAGSITDTAATGHTTNCLLSIEENAGTSITETALGAIENDAGTTIIYTAGTTILIDGGGKVTVSSDVEVEVIAPSAKVTAPSITLTGNVLLTGNLTVTGTVTAAGFSGPGAGAASFANGLSTPSAIINGIASETHKHNETGTVTSTPIAGP